MKKLIIVLAIALAGVTSCKKKDAANDGEGAKNFKISDYVIVGDTFWGNNLNVTPPYIMTFREDGKVIWYRPDGKGETTYEVEGNRIFLESVGYIDIENGQVSNMMLAGPNLNKGKLIKRATEKSYLQKTFSGGQRKIWKADGTDRAEADAGAVTITFEGDKIVARYMYAGNVPVKDESTYTPIFNDGGFVADKALFYVDQINGKLTYWRYSGGDYYVYYKY